MLFQFTPLREGRQISGERSARTTAISIHAPPRGATILPANTLHESLFQFTPLREGRPPVRSRWQTIQLDFNSRPSARGDEALLDLNPLRGQFQFTPLREGRHVSRSASPAALPFQFTPLREGRLSRAACTGRTSRFQFTPLREGRRNKKL